MSTPLDDLTNLDFKSASGCARHLLLWRPELSTHPRGRAMLVYAFANSSRGAATSSSLMYIPK